ncbi:MAG: hypothetical protein K8W52_39365 [Deltaproteobacteria bacterium]|nr:hypothetical protein [Deltaproteobacteria bacterium]
MPRINAPELEDYPWFPARMRDALTGYLRVAAAALSVPAVAAPLLREALDASDTRRVIDLCAGGGGPLLGVLRTLADEGERVPAVLTDLYPNRAAFARAEALFPGQVTGRIEPTDATQVPAELRGVRTIFNALHHLPPPVARAVFADAAAQRQPIVAFEFVERSLQGLAISAILPASVLALTPFVRPVDLRSLALTYVVPVLPAITWWDGTASCLRAYSVPELHDLVDDLATPDYGFRIERRRVPWRPHAVTYVVGLPRTS